MAKERRELICSTNTGTGFQDNSTDLGSGVLLPDLSSPSPEALFFAPNNLNLHHEDDEVLPVTAFPKKVGVKPLLPIKKEENIGIYFSLVESRP